MTNRVHCPSRWPIDGALSLARTDIAFIAFLKRIGIDVDHDEGCRRVYQAAERIVFQHAGEKK